MRDDAAPFRPLETRLDPEAAQDILKTALAGADDGELFFERRRSEALLFDDGRLKNASYDASEGFGLRAVKGEATGYAHATEMTEAALRRAAQTVRLAVGDGGGTMAVAPRSTNTRLYSDADPMADAAFSVKVDVLREIDAFCRDTDPRVVQVSASIAASLQEVEILRADGPARRDVRPMTRVNISVIMEENGRRESGTSGGGGRYSLSPLLEPDHWKGVAMEAIRVATVNLGAEPAPAGVFDVALGPGWPGILLHEAVGHGLEGDFNRKKTSAFADLMGQRVAAPGVTVLDDGTIPDRRGSISIDDEGTPSGKNVLIEDGILVGYMQDRQNARLMGVDPTGNGRRESYAHAPMPRMTNTYMLAGDAAPGDVVAEVKDGIHAVGFGGGQVDITNGKFVFSCTEAYRVKNGKRGAPVKGATLIGDGATALQQIRAIGNDFSLDPGMGNCGKSGQWVPVGVGQPTLLIGGLTVGGSAI
ncbi:MAG: metalloprotease TldD [Pseudomonadota bacterium]